MSLALLAARWAEGRDIGDPDVLAAIAADVGIGRQAARNAIADPASRHALNDATRQALKRGVFGSPTVAVNDELFWGVDRLPLLEQYLAAGERYAPGRDRVKALHSLT